MIDHIGQLKPQQHNANKHTPRGMKVLEDSVQRDGWIGAITVAADNEIFDGSARQEVGAATGFEDVILVESDGTKPIVIKRTDIPTATDPRARRLGIAANRAAQLNLEWEPAVLDDDKDLLAGMFSTVELDLLLAQISVEDAFGNLRDGDKAPFEQMTFTLANEQADTVRTAMNKARKLGVFVDTGNENGNGNALARICEAYLG